LKIAIDGFTLALKEGTGLATATDQLARTLASGGHDLSVIYGLTGVGRDPALMWPRLLQALGVRGEAQVHEWLRWAPLTAAMLAPYLAGWRFQVRPVPRRADVATAGSSARIPAGADVYNAPSIFYAAQSYASIFGKPVRLRKLPGVDVFHRSSPLPLHMEGVANVMMVHDVIPLAMPHSTAINLRHYRRIMEASLRDADLLLLISEHSRRDLLSFFDVPPEKAVVCYQSVEIPEALRDIDADEMRRQLDSLYGLEPGGYFLFYGAIEPKKNVGRILDALAYARNELPLVIAGRNGWLYQQEVKRMRTMLRNPRTAGRLRRHEYLPFAQLMLLLKGARGLVFPSLYEGFGLPVLEAMMMGVPVITSNTTSLPEVAGDAALLVDPLDPRAIAAAMDRLAGDDALCADLVRRGTQQAAQFTPQKYLERIEQAYRQVLR